MPQQCKTNTSWHSRGSAACLLKGRETLMHSIYLLAWWWPNSWLQPSLFLPAPAVYPGSTKTCAQRPRGWGKVCAVCCGCLTVNQYLKTPFQQHSCPQLFQVPRWPTVTLVLLGPPTAAGPGRLGHAWRGGRPTGMPQLPPQNHRMV